MRYAASGHRPDKLGGYGSEATALLREFARSYMQRECADATEIISGMALGWDTAWARAALDLGKPLTCAVPFKGQEMRWPQESQREYLRILEQAKRVVYTGTPGYSDHKMHARNHWMVDNCDTLIVLWNGDRRGGTFGCVQYADRKDREYRNLWDMYEAFLFGVPP